MGMPNVGTSIKLQKLTNCVWVGDCKISIFYFFICSMNIHAVVSIWGYNGEWRFYCCVLVSCWRSYCRFHAGRRKIDSLYMDRAIN